eukprot:TRINITY_DN50414_c0_g1_i12.p2 TRINITY_DN50414_c0_g1~~TRINITY_DN50414_c0_g1_i12.p2  ORF type:complete len:139 (-),score=11.91 TRINITY_DN50414_c0_g1_i12:4-420(-)
MEGKFKRERLMYLWVVIYCLTRHVFSFSANNTQLCDSIFDDVRHPFPGLGVKHMGKGVVDKNSYTLSPCTSYYFSLSMRPNSLKDGSFLEIEIFQPFAAGFGGHEDNFHEGYLKICIQIPALIAYINVVAVKKLVVES